MRRTKAEDRREGQAAKQKTDAEQNSKRNPQHPDHHLLLLQGALGTRTCVLFCGSATARCSVRRNPSTADVSVTVFSSEARPKKFPPMAARCRGDQIERGREKQIGRAKSRRSVCDVMTWYGRTSLNSTKKKKKKGWRGSCDELAAEGTARRHELVREEKR